jgi:hypothetical protein
MFKRMMNALLADEIILSNFQDKQIYVYYMY